jgi:protein-glucosylgalactosylhydroxylysine glucosidase
VSIDRLRLARRHNPVLRGFDPRSPLSVGNGELAFSVDCTGLQTFRALYAEGTPLCTQSQWGWHSFPRRGTSALRLREYHAGGRTISLPTSSDGQEDLYDHLRRNPHRLNLASIGLRLLPAGSVLRLEDVRDVRQELDLWSGVIESRWTFAGSPARVQTACHPYRDAIALEIVSPLCAGGSIAVEITYSYGSPEMTATDEDSPAGHRSDALSCPGGTRIRRTVDDTVYSCTVFSTASMRFDRAGEHAFVLRPATGQERLAVVIEFTRGDQAPPCLEPDNLLAASAGAWQRFWQHGGSFECAESRDPRAVELERRVVLSQYLTRIQCAGSLPPQETGLTCNSWYGKFHLEMHPWHAAHFAPWGRPALLERSMGYYHRILDSSRRRALAQGLDGARWPKMVGPDGEDSPSPIGPLLAWQQPHPILLAELLYRADPGSAARVLEEHAEIVFASAQCMASFARQEDHGGRSVLGPPLIPAQENHAPEVTLNPTFELEYWDFGLRTANEWRARLGLPRDSAWDAVVRGLAALPTAGGVYLSHEGCPDTYGAFADDHPTLLAALGLLPGRKVDRAVMARTHDRVLASWRFDGTWGWDFPMMAMTAARLGRGGDAVNALLMPTPKNTWLVNGHTPQVPKRDLPVYLPSNGGLLLAIALMAGGWDGAPPGRAPGFPADGSWDVRCEGVAPLP